MKMLENLQDDFDFNYKTLKSAGGMRSICCCNFFLSQIASITDKISSNLLRFRVVPGPEWKQPGSSHQTEDVSAGADAERSGSVEEGEIHNQVTKYSVGF